MNPRIFVATAVAVVALLTRASPLSSQTVAFPDEVRSVWTQPGREPLDGVGAYVYIGGDPTPDPAQVPSDYEYYIHVVYEDSPNPGAIVLGSVHHEGTIVRIAGLSTGGSFPVAVPYDWSPGRLYFLLVHTLGPGAWGGWVLDVWADEWTFIGQGWTPVEWGRLSPTSSTVAGWRGAPVEPGACSAYPRTDAFFTPAIGVRAGSFSLGSLASDGITLHGCPSEVSSFLGWAHYRLGV